MRACPQNAADQREQLKIVLQGHDWPAGLLTVHLHTAERQYSKNARVDTSLAQHSKG